MLSFYGLCDGKIMVRKTIFLEFCVEILCSFSRKNIGAVSNLKISLINYV